MVTWEALLLKVEGYKTEFLRIHKCLNKTELPSLTTTKNHIFNIIEQVNLIKEEFSINYNLFSKDQKFKAVQIHNDIRDCLLKLFAKLNVTIEIPFSVDTKISTIDLDNILNIWAGLQNENEMAPPTKIEFINTFSKFIPAYDGNPDNLQSCLDALALIDDSSEGNVDTAVRMIKSKLVGKARSCLNDSDNTIQLIIAKLRNNIKGESTKAIIAKMKNLKQTNKSANNYMTEIQKLTDTLKISYISEGMSSEVAGRQATERTVEVLKQNATNDKVKAVLDAGNFNDMNDIVEKFVSVSNDTPANGTINYLHNNRRPDVRGGRRNYQNSNFNNSRNYRGNNRNNWNNNRSNNNNRYNRGNNYRGNNRSFNGYNNNNNRHVRIIETDQGNSVSPQQNQNARLGDMNREYSA